jgi:manganese transport protein
MAEKNRHRSLSEVHSTVAVPSHPSFWRRLLAFSGPAYLVSVGYMDPGNWATDIAAGSRFGYRLLWVLLLSNIMAVLLQSFSARLGIVSGMDLAQACRRMYSKWVARALWVLAEIAIAACDLAEVLGSAIGIQLLFGIPLLIAVFITAADTFVLLLLHSKGMRLMEAFIVTLILTIGICLGIEVLLARPAWEPLVAGLVPSLPGHGALYLAVGILGATVMPHNLYLHTALVQSRRFRQTPSGVRSGIRFNTLDSIIALNGAFLVNAALLIMAAATFYTVGLFNVAEIQQAHRLLEPLLGARIAPVVFAIALIAAGQSSTLTGTLAGQVVMEGFIQLRLRPVVRRLVTRSLALVPAVATILLLGEGATGDLLVLSQVILSLQLCFAVIPLVHLVSDRRWLGSFRVGPIAATAGWITALIIALLNLELARQEIVGWLSSAGGARWILLATVVPLSIGLVALLFYVAGKPLVDRWRGAETAAAEGVHGPSRVPMLEPPRLPRRIAVAVDFSSADAAALSYAVGLTQRRTRKVELILLHVVESGGARVMGGELKDQETQSDQARLALYLEELAEQGVDGDYDLGFGDPPTVLAELIAKHRPDLVVAGSHGHRRVADLLYGTSIERLRHLINVPLLVVPEAADD